MKKPDDAWKQEPIPTPDEVDVWLVEAADGFGRPNFISKLVLAYRKLYYDKASRVGKRRRR